MKVAHISFVPNSYIGVKNKLDSQSSSFSRLYDLVMYSRFEGTGYYIDDKLVLPLASNNGVIRKLVEPKLFSLLISNFGQDIDVAYVRYMRMTPWFFIFLKKLKKLAKKVVLEIPAYPYDSEYNGRSFLSVVDRYYRGRLSSCVDLITYYGGEYEEIFGVPCLRLTNGISMERNPMVDITVNPNKNSLNLIAVANFARWHGYDRLIRSLANLNSKSEVDINLHMVGDGPELNSLKELTEDLSLNERVIFYGPKSGKELDIIYNSMDVAVCSLGLYRINHDILSPLKPAEYIARGLPIILGNNDERFDQQRFIFRVPNDPSDIDFYRFVNWYNLLDCSPEYIREYATEKLTWDFQVKKVIDFLNS